MSLTPCTTCGRTFNEKSLAIHSRTCRGLAQKLTPKTNTPGQADSFNNIYDDFDGDPGFQGGRGGIGGSGHSKVEHSNFIVCDTCGKTFTIHSIDKHKPACLKKVKIEKEEQEAQRRHNEGPQHVGRLPGAVCYICGRNFGTKSIEIHEVKCLEKFRKENSMLPRNERRPEPIKPQMQRETLENMVKEQKINGNKGYDLEAAMNDIKAEAYNKNLLPCKNCGRTFNPDAMKHHAKACTSKHPARKVGHVVGH